MSKLVENPEEYRRLLAELSIAKDEVKATLPQDYVYSLVEHNNGRCTIRVFQSARTGKASVKIDRLKDGSLRFHTKHRIIFLCSPLWRYVGFEDARYGLTTKLRQCLIRRIGKSSVNRTLLHSISAFPKDPFAVAFKRAIAELFEHQYCLVSENGQVTNLTSSIDNAVNSVVKHYAVNTEATSLMSMTGLIAYLGNGEKRSNEYDFTVRNLEQVRYCKNKHGLAWSLWIAYLNTFSSDTHNFYPIRLKEKEFVKHVSDVFGLSDRHWSYLPGLQGWFPTVSNGDDLVATVKLGLQALESTGVAPANEQSYRDVMRLTEHHQFFANASWEYGSPWPMWVHVLRQAMSSQSNTAYRHMMERVGKCLRFHVEQNKPWPMVSWSEYVNRTSEWEKEQR